MKRNWIRVSLFSILILGSPLFSESISHLSGTRPSESARTESNSRPLAVPKKAWGVQFDCSPQEITQLKKDFVQLFSDYGWLEPRQLVEIHTTEANQLRLKLNTPLTDTDTFQLNTRKEFKIKDDQDHFTDRAGVEQKYLIASEKEIVAALLQNGRLHEFSGAHCSFQKFMEHVKIRKNIIKWGVRALWKFPEEGPVKRNEKMWKLGWELQPGVTSTQAVADAFVGELNYEMGCTVACQLIMAQGILDFHKNVKKDEPTSNHLNLITAKSPLDSMEPRTASRNATTKVSEGTLLDRHFNVPHNNWVPGDWGWIMNPDHASSEINGYEGANIVYIGRGLFVVYYDNDPDRTLDQALVRVYKWRDSSLRQPITPELVEQLRKDPRHGGLLRDVRDFPKNISSPSK